MSKCNCMPTNPDSIVGEENTAAILETEACLAVAPDAKLEQEEMLDTAQKVAEQPSATQEDEEKPEKPMESDTEPDPKLDLSLANDEPCGDHGCSDVVPAPPTIEPSVYNELVQSVAEIREASYKSAQSMREMHRLLHEEFAGRLRDMQQELDDYRKKERGFIYDGILAEVASLYCEGLPIVDEINDKVDATLHKKMRFHFERLYDLLESYGATLLHSAVGDKRNPRHSQVMHRVSTTDPELHDTVACSLSAGYYIDNRTLVKEKISVYIYKPE